MQILAHTHTSNTNNRTCGRTSHDTERKLQYNTFPASNTWMLPTTAQCTTCIVQQPQNNNVTSIPKRMQTCILPKASGDQLMVNASHTDPDTFTRRNTTFAQHFVAMSTTNCRPPHTGRTAHECAHAVPLGQPKPPLPTRPSSRSAGNSSNKG